MFDYLKPKHWLILLIVIQAVIEFYPIDKTFSLTTLGFLCIACLVYFIMNPSAKLIGSYNILPVLFLAFWFSYNALTILWANDTKHVIVHIMVIMRYGLLFLIFSNLFRIRAILNKFHWFILVMLVLYLATAIWELVTWQHLPSSRFYQKLHFMPTGPFFGENVLAGYFLLFTPFILFISKITNRAWLAIVSGILVISIFSIVILQGARIAILAYFALFLYYFVWQTNWKSKIILILVLLLIGGGIYFVFQQQVDLLIDVLKHQTETIGADTESIHMSSVKIRAQLFFEAFDIAFGTGLMGVGGGNFENEMHTGRLFKTGWMTNPHNYLMEIFANWGILVLCGFLLVYLRWVYKLFYHHRNTHGRDRYLYLMYLSSLVLFLPTSILPSSIRTDYLIWIYFAAVNAMCNIAAESKVTEHELVEG